MRLPVARLHGLNGDSTNNFDTHMKKLDALESQAKALLNSHDLNTISKRVNQIRFDAGYLLRTLKASPEQRLFFMAKYKQAGGELQKVVVYIGELKKLGVDVPPDVNPNPNTLPKDTMLTDDVGFPWLPVVGIGGAALAAILLLKG